MRPGQIGDMNIIADAGSVRRRIVGAEHVELRPQAQRRLGRHFDQMRGVGGRLAGAAARIGAGDVEIAQDHVAQIVRAAGVAQHDFGHQLRPAVGRDRHGRRILRHRDRSRIAVHRRGRGEDEMAHAAFDRAFDQRARVRRVVAVVAERIAHRIRHHDRGGEMDDGVDVMLAHKPRDQGLVAGLADDERNALGNGPAMPGRQIVEHYDRLAGIAPARAPSGCRYSRRPR